MNDARSPKTKTRPTTQKMSETISRCGIAASPYTDAGNTSSPIFASHSTMFWRFASTAHEAKSPRTMPNPHWIMP